MGKSSWKWKEYYSEGSFSEMKVYFKGILMNLSLFCCILLITLLSRKFGIAEKIMHFLG